MENFFSRIAVFGLGITELGNPKKIPKICRENLAVLEKLIALWLRISKAWKPQKNPGNLQGEFGGF